MKHPKIKIKAVCDNCSNKHYYFNVTGFNGAILASSEMYTREDSAIRGARRLLRSILHASIEGRSGEEIKL